MTDQPQKKQTSDVKALASLGLIAAFFALIFATINGLKDWIVGRKVADYTAQKVHENAIKQQEETMSMWASMTDEAVELANSADVTQLHQQ